MMESLVVEIDRVLARCMYISSTCMHMFLYPPIRLDHPKYISINILLFYRKTFEICLSNDRIYIGFVRTPHSRLVIVNGNMCVCHRMKILNEIEDHSNRI